MSKISRGALHELGNEMERKGYASKDLDVLRSKSGLLQQIKAVLNGTAKINFIEHIIDLDADPFVPEGRTVDEHIIDLDADPFVPGGWTVYEHIKLGQLIWDPSKIELFLSVEQRGFFERRAYMYGRYLYGRLKEKPALNANVLDYLLAHPELIPEEWKGKYICFWGTIYRDSYGCLCVRYLHRLIGTWCWSSYQIHRDFWHRDSPAALLASK